MSARDDFGSRSGTGESYRGGARNSNGGISGGRAGHNGGNTGLGTDATMYGNTAFGPAGGMTRGYATTTNGGFGGYSNRDGTPMFSGPYQSGYGRNAGTVADRIASQNTAWAEAQRRATPVSAPPSPLQSAYPTPTPPAVVPQQPVGAVPVKPVMGWLPTWPGTGQWWGNAPRFNNNAATWPRAMPSIPNGMRTDRFVGPNFSNSSRSWPTSDGYGPGEHRVGDQYGPGPSSDRNGRY